MDTSSDTTSADPAPGRRVILLSMTEGDPQPGSVRSWTGSNDGLVVSARISTSAVGTHLLADHRVWLSVPEGGTGFTVYSGVAHRADDRALDVTGIRTVVREQRRQHVRAPVDGTARIPASGQIHRQLRLVDLSQGGARVELREPSDLVLGERVALEVILEDGSAVPARGEVARVNPAASEAVVRFDDLAPEHGSRIDRYVLLHLTPPTTD